MSETFSVTGVAGVAAAATLELVMAPERWKSTGMPLPSSSATEASACRLAPLVSWVNACSASIGAIGVAQHGVVVGVDQGLVGGDQGLDRRVLGGTPPW